MAHAQLHERTLRIFLLSLLLLELAYTFMQHYTAPLDGDLAAIVVPDAHYEAVLDNPLGWKAIKEDTTYAAPNRFFVHWAMFHYYRWAPALLRLTAGPVNAIYLSSAMQKTAFHLLLLLLLALYIRKHGEHWLLPACLLAPLFLSGGFNYNLMGVVDRSPTYAFFYAFPLLLLLLYYLPAYKALNSGDSQRLSGWKLTGLFALAVVIPFSGPLAPGVVLVVSFLVVLRGFSRWKEWKESLPPGYWLSMLLLNGLCLYSLYLGSYNIEQHDSLSLWGRYALLPEGLFHQFTRKPGPGMLLAGIAVNVLLLRFRVNSEEARLPLKVLAWIGLFSLCYLLLLPLGGYREYRPLVIRRDTILPVLLLLIFFWGLSAKVLLQALPSPLRRWHLAFVLLLLTLFTLTDEPEWQANACERAKLEQLVASGKEIVEINDNCPLLGWEPLRSPQSAEVPCQLLRLWGVLEEGQCFLQE